MTRSYSTSLAAVTLAIGALGACADQAQPTAPRAAPAVAAAVAAPPVTSSGSTVCLAYVNKQAVARLKLEAAAKRTVDVAARAELQEKVARLDEITADACN